MDYTKLKIGHIDKVNGRVALSTNFYNEEVKFAAAEKNKGFFKEEFKNKRLIIKGENYTQEVNILDIEVTSSIIEFKTLNFLVDLEEIGDMKVNDLVEVV